MVLTINGCGNSVQRDRFVPLDVALPSKDAAAAYFDEIFVLYSGSRSRTSISHGAVLHCIDEFRVLMNDIGA